MLIGALFQREHTEKKHNSSKYHRDLLPPIWSIEVISRFEFFWEIECGPNDKEQLRDKQQNSMDLDHSIGNGILRVFEGVIELKKHKQIECPHNNIHTNIIAVS